MAAVRHYVARSPAAFERIADWVSDSCSATDQLRFDAEQGELRVAFENAPPPDDADDFPKAELLKETRWGRYYKQPYFRCLMKVSNAVRTEPDLAALDEPVSFSDPEVGTDGRSIRFASDTDSDFVVFVSALDVELEVTDEIAYYREQGFGRGAIAWESRGPISS
jgi:hypothetical protein